MARRTKDFKRATVRRTGDEKIDRQNTEAARLINDSLEQLEDLVDRLDNINLTSGGDVSGDLDDLKVTGIQGASVGSSRREGAAFVYDGASHEPKRVLASMTHLAGYAGSFTPSVEDFGIMVTSSGSTVNLPDPTNSANHGRMYLVITLGTTDFATTGTNNMRFGGVSDDGFSITTRLAVLCICSPQTNQWLLGEVAG